MNDRAVIEEIRQRLPIADIVSEHVALKKAGSTLKGLCPFHSEKTPSFIVNNERGLFKCFGCGESGDIFSFLMKITGVTFAEALQELARRAGVTLTQRGGGDTGLREALLSINERALALFRENLAGDAGKEALAYLAGRGIDRATVEQFRLGLAIKSFQQLTAKLQRQYPIEALEASGLVRRNSAGKWYDLFRDRIVFPIFDTAGRCIAFGARLYHPDQEGPKYINSPETPVYTKGRHLYGFFQAKDSIKRLGRVILVEGYTDVIMAHRHGFTNVIAGLGTALTRDQLGLIRRFTKEIVLAYDADAAGQHAADRGIDLALDQGLTVRVAVFPDGLDPADAIVERGADTFAAAVENARDFLDFRIASSLANAKTPIARATAARELVKSLDSLQDRIVRATVLRTIAERFGVAESALLAEWQAPSPTAAAPRRETLVKRAGPRLDAELQLLKLMLEDREVLQLAAKRLRATDLSKEPRQVVFDALIAAADRGEPLAGDLGGRLSGLSLDLLAHISTVAEPPGDHRRLFADIERHIKLRRIDAEINDCTVSLRQGDIAPADQEPLRRRLAALLKEKRGFLARQSGKPAGRPDQ